MSEDKQIQAMIDFIERDAQEKIREYEDEAQNQYDAEKANLVEAEKKKVIASSENRKKQIEVERRVARANLVKEQRLRVMEERGVILDQLRDAAKAEVFALMKDPAKYKVLLKGFFLQAAVALQSDCEVQCRKIDENVVKSLIAEGVEAVKAAHGKQVTISVSKTSLIDDAWGGVILVSADGKIVCNNTLSYRAHHAFHEQLPTIRYLLFHDQAQL